MTNSMVEELPTPPPPLGTVDPWWKPLLRRRMLLIVAFMFVTMSFIRANAHGATKLSASFTVFTTLEFTMPILLAGLAGLWAERVGVVNIGIEGMMIFGTWFGAVGAWKWGPWVGLLLAVIGGMIGGAIHAVATVTFNVDHIISGVAINLLAFGAMRYISELWWGPGADNVPQGAGITQSPQQKWSLPRFDVPFLAGGRIGSWHTPDMMGWLEKRGWPVIGDAASILRGFTSRISVATIIALLLVPLSSWVLWRTRFGLRVRSSGEDPASAESLGVRVAGLRYRALIISGGFNIYPREIEEMLETFDGVEEAAVVGAPHPEWGEVPVAYIVCSTILDQERLVTYCRGQLASFKVPKEFYTVESLPRNAMGKLQKHLLRAKGG